MLERDHKTCQHDHFAQVIWVGDTLSWPAMSPESVGINSQVRFSTRGCYLS